MRRAVGLAMAGLLLGATLAGGATAQDEASQVAALLRDLRGADFDQAYAAAEQLGRHPGRRTQVVPALIEAATRGEWNRCSADVRDAVARSLGRLGAREAVVPLLELVRSGRPIEHECVE